jgi:hypothetical protein
MRTVQMSKPITVTVEMTPERAAALALFLKRLLLDDFKAKCSKPELVDEQHYTMQAAADDLREALAEKGVAPR